VHPYRQPPPPDRLASHAAVLTASSPVSTPRQPGCLPHLACCRPRVQERHAAVLADGAVYPVRHRRPPRLDRVSESSRVVSAALTLSTVVSRSSPPNRACRATVHASSCRLRDAIYARQLGRAAIHAPVRPRRAFPWPPPVRW
jgi:hypothetical protein